MNIENNQRYQQTEEKIVKAYGHLATQKSVDKITVTDICKEANIHRTSFYGHFESILELSSYVSNLQFQNLIKEFVTEDGWDLYQGILSELKFFYCHQALIRKNFKEASSTEHINKIFMELITPDLQTSYKKKFNLKNDTELIYHQSFVGAGFIEIIKRWILSGCQETPETIAGIMCNFLR